MCLEPIRVQELHSGSSEVCLGHSEMHPGLQEVSLARLETQEVHPWVAGVVVMAVAVAAAAAVECNVKMTV